MTKVLFIGDEPSSKNVSNFVPFVGAKCFDTLVEWIKYLEPDFYFIVNSDSYHDFMFINDLRKTDFKFVALGKNASKRLDTMAIKHFTLPHPSGLNRKLNNKEYLKEQLNSCGRYLYND